MAAEVITFPMYEAIFGKLADLPGAQVVNTVSHGTGWQRELSPFLLGPVHLWDVFVAKNVENAWQYCKVYKQHLDYTGQEPNDDWWEWAQKGWENPRAVRYPMGKGAKPVFSYWDGYFLSYVQARKVIYGPLYAEAVQKTDAWKRLKELYRTKKYLVLLDYDVRDTRKTKETMTQVLNNPDKKMGHAFVLKMMLTNDDALIQMDLRGDIK